MRVYLDNCSFNRPFDDQRQIRVRLEAEAKLFVQQKIREGALELAWSYILEYENQANPFAERREAVLVWKRYACIDSEESHSITKKAAELQSKGLKSKDALHVACAIEMGCDYFLTTDDRLLKRMTNSVEIRAVDPVTFVREVNV